MRRVRSYNGISLWRSHRSWKTHATSLRQPCPQRVRRRDRRFFPKGLFSKKGWILAGSGLCLMGNILLWKPLDPLMDYVGRLGADSLAWAGFYLKDIHVQGLVRTNPRELLGAVGVGKGAAILAIDITATQMRIENLPWVAQATVERRLPHELAITIKERVPVARWQWKEQMIMLDRAGQPIQAIQSDAFQHLPLLIGHDAPTHSPALFNMLASQPQLAHLLRAAARMGKRRWDLRLDPNIDLRLPEQGAQEAWDRFADLEQRQRLLKRKAVVIDLRIPDRIVIHRPDSPKQGSTHRVTWKP